MIEKYYIEDLFLDLYKILVKHDTVDHKDRQALDDFYYIVISDKLLTEKQGNYLRRLMCKYTDHDLEINLQVASATWKQKFRVVDLEKKLSISKDDHRLTLDFKFPYDFKNIFDQEIGSSTVRWNNDLKLSQIPFFSANFSWIMEFASKHNFTMENELYKLQADYEEIQNQREDIEPYSTNHGQEIILVNCSEDTQEYFDRNKKSVMIQDIYLAKQMGFPYRGTGIEDGFRGFFSDHKSIHEIDIDGLLRFGMYVDKNLCIVLDKINDYISMAKKIVKVAENIGLDRSTIKICFREKNQLNCEFNQWIKSNGLGGPVISGKIFLFLGTPPKWYLREKINDAVFAISDQKRNMPVISKNLLLSKSFAFIIKEKN